MRGKKLRSPARKDSVMGRISESIGQDEMVDTLAGTQDPRAGRLLEMLFDPAYRQHSFPKLCEKVHLSVTDVVDLFRRFKLDQGIVAMAKAAPRIMSDTAIDAESTLSPCMNCSGTGLLIVESSEGDIERPCPSCLGRGSFRAPGHDKARDLFFRTMGLTGKKGPLLAQQINISSPEIPTIEDFVNETEKAMKDEKRRR